MAASNSRRIRFGLTLAVLVVILCEAVAAIGLRLTYPDTSGLELKRIQESLAHTSRSGSDRPHAIHPFLGWVHDPDISDGEKVFGVTVPANVFGFVDDRSALQER